MNPNKIAFFKYQRPFVFPYSSPHTSRTSAESVIVQLVFDEGISGYGESAPRDYVTGENCTSVHRVIKDVFSPILLHHHISRLEDIQEVLELLEHECTRRNLAHYNSALCAVDLALLDALGKFQKLPVTRYLGSIQKKSAPYSISLPLIPLEKIEDLFSKYHHLCFQHIKVLVGQDVKENVKRVELIRMRLGEDFDIRLEANGKWTYPQAISHLEKLVHYNVSAVEEPLPPGDIRGLQEIKKRFNLKIIVDESMCTLSQAQTLIEAGACDIMNIKISKCGGLLRSKTIAEFSADRGVPSSLGCHVGESEILRKAGQHFAATTPDLLFVEGYTDLLFQNSIQPEKREAWTEGTHKKQAHSGLGLEPGGSSLLKEWLIPLETIRP